MTNLSFTEISERLGKTHFPEIDVVIGIGTGGIVVSSLIAHQLSKPLHLIKVNYRNMDNSIKYDEPQLLKENTFLGNDDIKVLLVDDVSVSGKTLVFAKQILNFKDVTTFVLKGKNADIVLFPEIKECVNWPWNI